MPTLSEDQIRAIARIAKEELGEAATYDRLREVVAAVVRQMEEDGPGSFPQPPRMRHLVICLSPDGQANGQTLSQGLKGSACVIGDRFERLLGGIHVLLAAVDGGDPSDLRARLAQAGNPLGVRVIIQPEEALKRVRLPDGESG